nr:glutamyl-tRNA reductase [Brevibacterium sp. 50QC2O2]
MTLLVIGVNHRTAPMSVLEAFSLGGGEVTDLRTRALAGEYVAGVNVLSTCNRLEVLADVTAFHGGLADIGTALVAVTGLDWQELSQHLYAHFGEKAEEHLFTLAAGLDSMALGESQILGQLRDSARASRQAKTLTPDMIHILDKALEVGKRAHSETALDSVAQSLLESALVAGVAHIGPLTRANALVIGAGAMSGLAVTTLHRHSIKSITVLGRTLEKAERLVAPLGGRAVQWTDEALVRELAAADLIVSVTGARGTVVDKDTAIEALQRDEVGSKNKFFIDLALPHDIAHDVAELPHVRVMGLSELSRQFADTSSQETSSVVAVIGEVKEIIQAALDEEAVHRVAKKVSPTVSALREQAQEIVDGEYDRLARKLGGDVPQSQLAEIRRTLQRIAEKIIHTPTVRVKELSAEDESVDYAAALTNLFDLSKTPADKQGELDRNRVDFSAEGMPKRTASANHYVPADGLRPVADHTLDVVEPEFFTGRTMRLGTRRSRLARSQSTAVAQQLAALTGWRIEIVEVVTEGDVNMTPLAKLGGSGVFVSAVRRALLTGKVDMVVHSLKDLPTAPAAGIDLAAVPPRVDPSDVLITRDGLTLDELPAGAVVGTGSPRRAAQLRAARPDLDVRGVRGNVDTRIKHVTEGRLDGVVIAAAGVRRLGRLAEVTDTLDTSVMLPAAGQGALAIECRSEDADLSDTDAEIRAALNTINDPSTALRVAAERAVLSRSEAGCSAPIGALATIEGSTLRLASVMAGVDGHLQRVSHLTALPAGADGAPELSSSAALHAALRIGYDSADELLHILGEVPDTLAGSNAPTENLPGMVGGRS